MRLDCSKLSPGLYIGSAPPSAHALREAAFDCVVFCAREIQPPRHAVLGVAALYCPLDDNPYVPVPRGDWRLARETAGSVARRVRRGERVLVTCAQGRNRSGLVCGMALHLLTGAGGDRCVEHIQARRANALTNWQFVGLLRQLPAVRTRTQQAQPR